MRLCTCNAIGCAQKIPAERVFCARHVVFVQSDTRRIVERTFRPGRIFQSQVFRVSLDRAQAEILYALTEGHRMPRDGAFEWDEGVEPV